MTVHETTRVQRENEAASGIPRAPLDELGESVMLSHDRGRVLRW